MMMVFVKQRYNSFLWAFFILGAKVDVATGHPPVRFWFFRC